MSTFTRLYFVNRGPSIAGHDSSGRLDEQEVGSPDLAPSEPVGPEQDSERGQRGELTFYRLPHTSPRSHSPSQRQPAAMRRGARPDGNVDF